MGNAQSLPTFLFRSSLGFAVFASVGKQHASRKLGCGITYCKLMVPTIMLPNAYFCWMMKHKPGSFTGGAKTDTAWPVLRGYSKMARTVSKQSLMLLTHLLRHRVPFSIVLTSVGNFSTREIGRTRVRGFCFTAPNTESSAILCYCLPNTQSKWR